MLVVTVLVVGVLLSITALLKEHSINAENQDLLAKGRILSSAIQKNYETKGNLNEIDALVQNANHYIGACVWVLDSERNLAAISQTRDHKISRDHHDNGVCNYRTDAAMRQAALRNILPDIEPVFKNGTVVNNTFTHPYYGEKMLSVALPITAEDGKIRGALLLYSPIANIDSFLQKIYYFIGAVGLIALSLAFFAVNYLTNSIVKPLKEMQESADAIAKGKYNTSVKIKTTDEVGRLGASINLLAADLSAYIAELKKTDALRRDFIANVSHELRTPLTIIRGYTEALLLGTINEPTQINKYYSLMKNEALRLERLITDLLDISKLQSAKTCINDTIPLADLADNVINMVRQKSMGNDINLVAVNRAPRPVIKADGDRIIQLLLILIDNAIKYTPAGGTIVVTTFIEQKNAVLEIADTGIGIPADDIPYIWERFYKVDKYYTRNANGVGLGLAIAKQIIEMHNATVSVTSIVNQGTTISIRFPLSSNTGLC